MGPSFMKIWTCGSSPPSRSRNAWTRIKNVNSASGLSKIWNFFGAIQQISCRDWWPWTKPGYISMTRRQSNNELSGGITAHPAPQKFRVQKSAEMFSPRFFGIKTASSSLIIFEKAKLSTRSINYLCWCNWMTFWRKNAAGRSPRVVLILHENAPAYLALATQKKLANRASSVLITHSILRIWPRRTTTCSLHW